MATKQETDQQLVLRVKNGDKQSFDLLVLKYQHKIYGLVRRYIHDDTESQDVTQEVFIKAYRAMGKFRGDSAFYTWLYRIAINTAKNYLVSKNRRPPYSDIDIEDAEYFEGATAMQANNSPEQELFKNELEKVVYSSIEQLPADLKTAVMLREFDGMSYEQIADIMQCPVGTVRSRIFRAREAIDNKIRGMLN